MIESDHLCDCDRTPTGPTCSDCCRRVHPAVLGRARADAETDAFLAEIKAQFG